MPCPHLGTEYQSGGVAADTDITAILSLSGRTSLFHRVIVSGKNHRLAQRTATNIRIQSQKSKKDVRPKIRENRAQNLSSAWPKDERSVWRLRDKPFADSNHITLLPSQDEGKNHSSGEAAVRPAFQCLLTAVRIKSIICFPFVRRNKNKQRQSKSNNEGNANGIEWSGGAAIGGTGGRKEDCTREP
jgi:hypothetical protein